MTILALLGAFLDSFTAYFGIFLYFFLVKFFLVKRPIMWLRGQKKMFFQDFLVVSGGYYAHFHAISALLGAFWTFFGGFLDSCCLLSWLSFSWSNVI